MTHLAGCSKVCGGEAGAAHPTQSASVPLSPATTQLTPMPDGTMHESRLPVDTTQVSFFLHQRNQVCVNQPHTPRTHARAHLNQPHMLRARRGRGNFWCRLCRTWTGCHCSRRGPCSPCAAWARCLVRVQPEGYIFWLPAAHLGGRRGGAMYSRCPQCTSISAFCPILFHCEPVLGWIGDSLYWLIYRRIPCHVTSTSYREAASKALGMNSLPQGPKRHTLNSPFLSLSPIFHLQKITWRSWQQSPACGEGIGEDGMLSALSQPGEQHWN